MKGVLGLGQELLGMVRMVENSTVCILTGVILDEEEAAEEGEEEAIETCSTAGETSTGRMPGTIGVSMSGTLKTYWIVTTRETEKKPTNHLIIATEKDLCTRIQTGPRAMVNRITWTCQIVSVITRSSLRLPSVSVQTPSTTTQLMLPITAGEGTQAIHRRLDTLFTTTITASTDKLVEERTGRGMMAGILSKTITIRTAERKRSRVNPTPLGRTSPAPSQRLPTTTANILWTLRSGHRISYATTTSSIVSRSTTPPPCLLFCIHAHKYATPLRFVLEVTSKTITFRYPKLRDLITLKDQLVADRATSPMYLKCDLKTFDLSSLGTKFDVILIDPPWEYARTDTLLLID